MSSLNIPFLYPQNCALLTWDEINQENRSRREYGDLNELAESISRLGLIHPPTITVDKILIGGGRRMAAMKLLGTTHYPVLYRESLTPAEIIEMEADENFKRLNMTWIERVNLISRSYYLKQKDKHSKGLEWNMTLAGKEFGMSRTNVANILVIFKLIEAGDEEIIKAENVTHAWEIILERRQNEALAESQRRSKSLIDLNLDLTSVKAVANPVGASNLPSPEISEDESPTDVSKYLTKPTASSPVVHTPNDSVINSMAEVSTEETGEFIYDLSKTFFHGDSVRTLLPAMPDECVNHIITDPPYAIDMANLQDIKDIHLVEEEHEVEENLEVLELFLQQAFRVVKRNGFVVFFYDLDHHVYLQTLARKIGFKVQRWPFTWVKAHNCKNQAPDYNFTKTTEVAMVLRKGNATLTSPQVRSHIICDGSLEQKMYNNPFAKPFEVWKTLIQAVALPGSSILDPFAGEMSSVRAFLNCQMKPIAMEKKEIHFNRGMDHIRTLLKEMSGGRAKFI